MFNYKELLSNMIFSFDDMSDVVVNPTQPKRISPEAPLSTLTIETGVC